MEENCQHRYFKTYVTFSSITVSIFSLYPLYYKIIKLLLSKITMDKILYLFLFFMGKKKSVQLPIYRSILFNIFSK